MFTSSLYLNSILFYWCHFVVIIKRKFIGHPHIYIIIETHYKISPQGRKKFSPYNVGTLYRGYRLYRGVCYRGIAPTKNRRLNRGVAIIGGIL